jgi:pimeloyl-ACP methyl ester carboxylesterase
MNATHYRTLNVDGLRLFYREAGPPDAPAVLLLHGFPSSSRMWQPLIDRLADRYRMVAPDYPGFGHSDAPPANSFSYTFDHVAEFIERFTDELALDRYSLVVQDYGGPVGMRLAVRQPNRLNALIVQTRSATKTALARCGKRGEHSGPIVRATRMRSARTSSPLPPRVSGTSGTVQNPTATTPTCGPTNSRSSTNPANTTSRPTCSTTTAPTWRTTRSGNSGYATRSLR